MAEQRLIDATDLIARGNASFDGVSDAVLLKKFVDAQPTIDPETLPIVRQLREELARMAAERDAAVADLKTMCDCDYCENDCVNTEEDTCEFCEVKNCSCRGCIDGRNWTWRGPQKEE